MSTIFLGMRSDQVRHMFEEIDSQLESKLKEVITSTFEKVTKDTTPRDSNYVYYDAHEIVLEAFQTLKNWADSRFTTSPEKEIAIAWVQGSFYRFEGPRSIQKEIRQILSNK